MSSRRNTLPVHACRKTLSKCTCKLISMDVSMYDFRGSGTHRGHHQKILRGEAQFSTKQTHKFLCTERQTQKLRVFTGEQHIASYFSISRRGSLICPSALFCWRRWCTYSYMRAFRGLQCYTAFMIPFGTYSISTVGVHGLQILYFTLDSTRGKLRFNHTCR